MFAVTKGDWNLKLVNMLSNEDQIKNDKDYPLLNTSLQLQSRVLKVNLI